MCGWCLTTQRARGLLSDRGRSAASAARPSASLRQGLTEPKCVRKLQEVVNAGDEVVQQQSSAMSAAHLMSDAHLKALQAAVLNQRSAGVPRQYETADIMTPVCAHLKALQAFRFSALGEAGCSLRYSERISCVCTSVCVAGVNVCIYYVYLYKLCTRSILWPPGVCGSPQPQQYQSLACETS